MTVSGSLKVNSGNLYTDGQLAVPGNLTMASSGPQIIEGQSPFTASHLRINSPAGVSVLNHITITDSLELQHGILSVDTSTPLYFNTSAASPSEYSGSYIVGRAIMGPRQVGSGALPPFLGCGLTNGSDIGIVTLTRTTGPSGIITERKRAAKPGEWTEQTSIASNWKIETSANPSSADRHASFYWLPEFDNGKDISQINLYSAPLGSEKYEQLNKKSAGLANTEMRIYTQSRVPRFNSTFTLTDNGSNLLTPPVGQAILDVYPNPFTDHLTLRFENTGDYPVEIKLINAIGEQLHQTSQVAINEEVTISGLGDLPLGNYWLQIYIHGFTVSTHIIKIQ